MTRLPHQADVLVGDMPFDEVRAQLEAEGQFSGVALTWWYKGKVQGIDLPFGWLKFRASNVEHQSERRQSCNSDRGRA